jgi:hypothetical protein
MKLFLYLQRRGLCLADGFSRLAATRSLPTNLASMYVSHSYIIIYNSEIKVERFVQLSVFQYNLIFRDVPSVKEPIETEFPRREA